MKHLLAILTILFCAATVQAADVGVSVSIGQPGFYGRIDVGSFPPPPVVYPRPIVIAPPPGRVVEAPIYLRVPPGHARDWSRNCQRYGACGRPVYFVQDRWYHDVYVRRHQEGRVQRDRGPDRDRGRDGGDRGYDRGRGHDRN